MDAPEKEKTIEAESFNEVVPVKLDHKGLPLIPQPSDDPEDVRRAFSDGFSCGTYLPVVAAQLESRAEVYYPLHCLDRRILRTHFTVKIIRFSAECRPGYLRPRHCQPRIRANRTGVGRHCRPSILHWCVGASHRRGVYLVSV